MVLSKAMKKFKKKPRGVDVRGCQGFQKYLFVGPHCFHKSKSVVGCGDEIHVYVDIDVNVDVIKSLR